MSLRIGGEGLIDSGGDLGRLGGGDLLRLLESRYGDREGGGGGGV